MKKPYNKPDVVFESFSLNTSVAANCALEANFSMGACGFEFTDTMTIFIDYTQGCTTIDTNNKYGDLVCYHNPADWNRLFNS